MGISLRSIITAGISTVTATTLAFAPSVQPPPPPERTIQLAVQPLAQQQDLLSILLTSPGRLLGPAVTPGTITPHPAPLAIPIAPNLADTIDGVYNAVEPWVRYGFQVAADVLGWVPYVGWLSGQIMVFYTFGEGIVQSAVFNFTDWLRGQGGVIENVVDFGVDVGAAFIWLGIDEWNYFLPPLPPLPFPIPPRPPLNQFAAFDTLLTTPDVGVANAASDLVDAIYIPVRDGISYGVNVLQAALAPIPLVSIVGDQVNLLYDVLAEPIANSVVFGLIDPVLNDPLNINNYINGALNVGGTVVNSLINTGIAEVNYVLGGGWIPFAASTTTDLTRAPENTGPINTGLNAVQTDVATGADISQTAAGGLTDMTETALNSGAKAVENVVTGEQSVSEAVENAAEEVGENTRTARTETLAKVSAATERHAKEATEIAKAPRTVAKGLVRAQGEMREAVVKATTDVANAARTGRPDKVAEEVAKAPTTVAKGLRDGTTEAAKGVEQAGKDARDAVNDAHDTGGE